MYLLHDDPVKAPARAIRQRTPAATAGPRLAILLFAALLGSSVAALAQCPALPAGASGMSILCSFDAGLTRLFTPRTAPEGAYRVYVTSSPLDKVAEQLRGKRGDGTSSGWVAQEMDPLEAFGSAGSYDQTLVARLYVGRRPRVARGPVVENGRVRASVWLVSPYPDPTLTRLEAGTLIIEFRVGKAQVGGEGW